MIYLISQLWVWLLLAMAFAALAGWAFAAQRAAPSQQAQRRERENLLSDILRLAGEDAGVGAIAADEREHDAASRQLELRDGRIAELERTLEHVRARADDLAGQLAEAQRRGPGDGEDRAELARLRAQVADFESERARMIDVETTPVETPPSQAADDDIALQGWRLRYFEQRVRYLENQARSATLAVSPAPPDDAAPPVMEWRAREAEARAAHLEEALRAAADAPKVAENSDEPAPFAANADVDMLLRWRMLYLERRAAYLQDQLARAPRAAAVEVGPDPDRWKWRARYLEARVRHLEQREPTVVVPQPVQSAPHAASERAVAPPRRSGVKPPVLAAARNGAPDDFTLIEGVSPLQQGTLNALGVFHFDQIAAWSPDHVAWVDSYLRLLGRIDEEDWVAQAAELARDGVAAVRRASEEEAL